MKVRRRRTREVAIGGVRIGSKRSVSVQSMTKTDTKDITKTVKQIRRLEKAGCDIIRVAVKDMAAVEALGGIKKKINNIPLVADIHFHYQLALKAIAEGVDGIRLNPGNINKKEHVSKIVKLAKKHRVSIRVGVNSGSLVSPRPTAHGPRRIAEMMVKSALAYIKLLESVDFYDIIISLKASDVVTTVEAYRRMAKLCEYPFHLGVTATGTKEAGSIASAIAIGSLLLEGIGDTIRVSLTASPEEEVRAGLEILSSLGLRSFGPRIISCPTCGRCEVNLVGIVKSLEKRLSTTNYQLSTQPVKLAVMGCVVNGPGEAKEADVGIACGKENGILFRKGKKIKKVKEEAIVNTLLEEIFSNSD